jgi:hypothetical protein
VGSTCTGCANAASSFWPANFLPALRACQVMFVSAELSWSACAASRGITGRIL